MYRNILIATDGSELADRAVAHGLALAKDVGAKVTAVTVTELWNIGDMVSAAKRGEGLAVDSYEKEAAANAQAILADVSTKARAAGVACETVHVPDSAPAEAILRMARDHGCDLIVIATHARTGLARLLDGSQAADVLAKAEVPVLICR